MSTFVIGYGILMAAIVIGFYAFLVIRIVRGSR